MAAQLSATSPGDSIDPAPESGRSEAEAVTEAEEHVEVGEEGEKAADVRAETEKESVAEVDRGGVRP